MERLDVNILERDFSFACPPDGRDALMGAAQHVDRIMRKLRQQAKPGTSFERIAVMAAVQLAAELLATPVGEGEQGEFALGDYQRKIEDMQQLLDGMLERHGLAANTSSPAAAQAPD